MKNLVISIVIGLGLVVGFGFEVNACEDEMIMSPYELACFEEMIWDMFLEDYCANYCEECDCYYYEICDCEVPCEECNESVECDFKVFICDNYDMIIDLAEEIQQEAKRDSIMSIASELCEF